LLSSGRVFGKDSEDRFVWVEGTTVLKWQREARNMTTPPTRPPTASELVVHPDVVRVLDEAWVDSQVNDPGNRHEEGGWIYMDLATAAIATRRAPAGTQSRLSLANPPLLPNHLIVATFHTHPNPASEGWAIGPSTHDEAAATQTGVP
jgi:hypothetical protein